MPKEKSLKKEKPKMLSGKIFLWLHKNWTNHKIFFLRHKTFFEIIFLISYGLEQVLVILALIRWTEHFFTVIAIYTAILISTIGLERTLMNFRYGDLREKSFEQTHTIMEMAKESRKITKRNKELEIAYLKK